MKLIIPPPVQGLIAGSAMWMVDAYLSVAPFEFQGRIPIAFGLIAIGLCVGLIAIGAFIKARTTVNPMAPDRATVLVVSGLYKISRNPMYFGLAVLLTGWGFYLGEAANLIVLALFISLITILQIKPEEEVLRAKFGDDYDDYCQRVRRWI
ncbi:MAG: isoprenylcysteine carboxylmethyltransferase family protein [Pseudomonadota bacterium]